MANDKRRRLLTKRILTVDDTQALYSFYTNLSDEIHALFRPFPEIHVDIIRRHLVESDNGKHISVGLIDENRIAGHSFVMEIHQRHPVFGLGLDGAYHGRGLGPSLARYVIDAADRIDIAEITLTVLKSNQKAFRIYKRLGFVLRGEHTFKVKHDSYFMIRNIEKTASETP